MPDLLGIGTAQPRLNLTGTASPNQAQPLANAWKVGEIVQAQVLGGSGAGMTRLDINGLEVSAKAPMPLAAGDRLELQVTAQGPPPQLRILQHQPAASDVLGQALRQALPRGMGSDVLPRLMETLAKASAARPEGLRLAIRQLVDALPSLARLTRPVELEQQIRASGLFLEHDLAQGAPEPGDLKAALLRALAALPPAAPRPTADIPPGPGAGEPSPTLPSASDASALADALREGVEGALARMQLNQIHSLLAQGTDQPLWVMEFPLPKEEADGPLRLRIRRDGGRGAGGEGGGWRLDLDLSIEPLGPLRASLLLRGEQLEVRLWAERPETVSRIQSHLDLLHAGLSHTGLEVGQLACYPGRPAEQDGLPLRPPGGLVDLSV